MRLDDNISPNPENASSTDKSDYSDKSDKSDKSDGNGALFTLNSNASEERLSPSGWQVPRAIETLSNSFAYKTTHYYASSPIFCIAKNNKAKRKTPDGQMKFAKVRSCFLRGLLTILGKKTKKMASPTGFEPVLPG